MSAIISRILFKSQLNVLITSKNVLAKCDLLLNNQRAAIRTIPLINQIQMTNTINLIKINNNANRNCKFKAIRNYIKLYSKDKTQQNGLNKPTQTQSQAINGTIEQQQQQVEAKLGIFKRFKEAYRKHGKVLIVCHVTTCIGWFCGFYVLSSSGFHITKLFNIFEKLHIISHETSVSIENKIETFNLEKFMRKMHLDYVFSDATLEWLGKSITGVQLKHVITALMLYKIFTPFRYLLTLGVTKLSIDLLKRRGVIMPPPPGSSFKELYEEQKQVLRRSIKQRREIYRINRSAARIQSSTNPANKKP